MAQSWTWNDLDQPNCCRTGSFDFNWLKDHPRGNCHTRSVKSLRKRHSPRAPTAIQVDRFHLLQNLAEALAQAFGPHSQALKTVGATQSLSSVTSPESTAVVPVLPPQPMPRSNALPNSRSRREADYQQVWELHHQGWLAPATARQGIGRTTVFRRHAPPPSRNAKDAVIVVEPPTLTLKDYVLQRWNDGCHDALRLFGRSKRGYSAAMMVVSMPVAFVKPEEQRNDGVH